MNSSFPDKIRSVFGNAVIDKRRLRSSQVEKRGVPAYVAEWILDTIVPGVGPLTTEEGERVREWCSRYIPAPGDQNVLKLAISRGDAVRILTPVEAKVELSKAGAKELADVRLLGISNAAIAPELLEQNRDLLRLGMWGVAELAQTDAGPTVTSFRPMQASSDLQQFKEARESFDLEEWRDILLVSMGYNPSAFADNQKTLILARLLPLVEKHMHIMELAPKGTGKSYFYENVSARVRLVSGGTVSPAVLFVNNATHQWGLLAKFVVVVLDEIQTLRFDKEGEIVGALKGYLANNKLTRGGLHEASAESSLVLLANIALGADQKPLGRSLVEELPEFLQETAFLDRIRGLIPGWELPKLASDFLAGSPDQELIGLKSDFFGDILIALREDLSLDELCMTKVRVGGSRKYKRNEDAVRSMAAGFAKILFPNARFTQSEFEVHCLKPAVRLRQLVWDEMQARDAEYRMYEGPIDASYVGRPV